MNAKSESWAKLGLQELTRLSHALDIRETAGQVQLAFKTICGGTDQRQVIHNSMWTLQSDGVRIDEEIHVPETWHDIPRVGIRFDLAPAFDTVRWHGLGPDESYPDRCGAQTVGHWQSSIADQYHPYVRPQEYGAHERAYSLQLTDPDGQGISISFPRPLSFTARPHHDADLSAAETLAQLQMRSSHEVRIDAAMRGLGTGACGPDALPPYIVGGGRHAFTWVLSALRRQ